MDRLHAEQLASHRQLEEALLGALALQRPASHQASHGHHRRVLRPSSSPPGSQTGSEAPSDVTSTPVATAGAIFGGEAATAEHEQPLTGRRRRHRRMWPGGGAPSSAEEAKGPR